MQNKRPLFGVINLLGLSLLALLAMSTSVLAQGSITGNVLNSSLSTPANGEIFFVGFLDNTDEEIRIESSDGAGYDNGNWYDDFQNYLTEAPGNPYVYYFYNPTNGEGHQLSKTIPSNSFQQENVLLAPVSWPAQPTGLLSTPVSASSMVITWNGVPGLTYHVYRRLASSNGSFFRIDNAAGPVSDAGVADSFFVDNTVDGVSSYDYLIMAEDASGNYSQHSVVLTVSSAVASAPVVASIVPDNGSAYGNTLVSIYGSGFDVNGVDAVIGTSSLSGVTVVSPFHITGLTPPGTVGVADVLVINTASVLASNTLTGAYTYNPNTSPVLAAIGPQATDEGVQLTFSPSASDVDGDIAIMTSSALPGTAAYVDNSDGTGTFDWTPTFADSGTYNVTFYATDPIDALLVDSEAVVITVNHVNQTPVLATVSDQSVLEGANLNFGVSASDFDGEFPLLTTSALPGAAAFVDNFDGTGTFDWTTTSADSGTYGVTFYAADALDPLLVDSQAITITVGDINLPPVLAAVGAQSTDEGVQLIFTPSASDPDGDFPIMTSTALPGTATYTDNSDGTGTFDWTPTLTDSGNYNVTFYATDLHDALLVDSEAVVITVNHVNQTPALAAISDQSVLEGVSLAFSISASDFDGEIPVLTTSVLPGTAAFVDNLDGTGSFDWTPAFTESGPHEVTFYAVDALDPLLTDSAIVTITVTEAGNQFPSIDTIGAQAVAEGGTLNLTVTASDPEGVPPVMTVIDIPANATYDDNFDGTGSFSFSPDLTQEGIYTVIFVATDDSLAADSLPVDITVGGTNQVPVLAAIGPQSTTEGINLNFALSAVDGDGDIPILTTSALPGAATFVDNLDGTGLFDWTPSFADSGTYDVTFYATDAVFSSDVDSELVTIEVIWAGNQAPVLTSIDSQFVAEGGNLNLAITAIDPDGNAAVLTAENLPLNATFVINPDSSGTFDFNPDYNQSGEYLVSFIASDGALADSADVVITVSEEGNMAPVFDSLGNFAVNEGDSLAIDVSATDPDGGPPSLAVNTALDQYTFVDNGDGTGRLVYRPDFYSAGLDTVRFIATDDGTPQRSTTVLSIITTNEVNLAPAIDSIGPFSVRTDRQLVFTITASDSTDADSSHRILLAAIDPPVNAFFVDNFDNTGTFTFTPVAGQEGVDTVTFLATDQGTPQLSASRAIEITVVGVNQPPILAEIGAQTVLEGETLEIVIAATDPDGGIPALLANDMPMNSSFVDSANGIGVFTFTPSFVQAGLHNVTFKAYDGLDIDKEVVLIQVYEAGNQVPLFTMIPSPQVTEGEFLEGILTAADPDSTPVFISLDTSGLVMENFTLVDSGNGVASFTISPDYVQAGLWDVSIAVSDGELADTSIMIVEVIEAGNQHPVLEAIEDQSVKEGLDLLFTVIASDPDEVTPKLSASPLPPGATFTDYLIGRADFNWTPGPTDSGTYPIKIYAEDGDFAGVFDSLELVITVIDSNFAPSIFPSPFFQATDVFEGEILTYRVQGSDPDGDFPVLGARLSASQIGDPLVPNMVFEDSANGFGGLTFAPDHTQGASNPTKFYIMFIAFDALDSAVYEEYGPVTFNVYPKNLLPAMTFELGTGPFSLQEGQSLAFSVTASDIDGALPPTITVENVPLNVSLSPPSDSIGFAFFPDYTQSGQYTVRFIATDDESAADTQDVVIDVGEVGNQSPQFITVLPAARDVSIGIFTEIAVEAFDPEKEALTLTASPAITNASFLDFGDGTGTFFITPDASQIDSVYTVTFIAEDPLLAADTISTVLTVVTLMRGDADSNRRYTMNDIVFLCSYLFRGGPAPTSTECGDVDNSGDTNVADIAYLVNYLYKFGPRPPQ